MLITGTYHIKHQKTLLLTSAYHFKPLEPTIPVVAPVQCSQTNTLSYEMLMLCFLTRIWNNIIMERDIKEVVELHKQLMECKTSKGQEKRQILNFRRN